MMFDDFEDNTERYSEFIEELLTANAEGNFDSVFNRAYGMGTFSEDDLINIYNMIDNDCVRNHKAKNTSPEAEAMHALRLKMLDSLSEANMSSISFELAATFFDHFTQEVTEMDTGEVMDKCLTRIFKCIASTGSWSEFFAGIEPIFHIYYSEFSERIQFDCSRLAAFSCNIDRGKQISEAENCHPSFREALLSRKDFS